MENPWKPYKKWMIWGDIPLFLETLIMAKPKVLDSHSVIQPFGGDV